MTLATLYDTDGNPITHGPVDLIRAARLQRTIEIGLGIVLWGAVIAAVIWL